MKKYKSYKGSGVEWIGDIPSHWNIVPFKREVNIENGWGHKATEIEDSESPVQGTKEPLGEAFVPVYDGEDVFLRKRRKTDQPVYLNGSSAIANTVFRCIPKASVLGKYVYYQSKRFPFYKFASETAVPGMTPMEMKSIEMPLPPLEEQYTIVTYLDDQTSKVDNLINSLEKQIEALKNYKSSLISEAVTGKMDLRDWKSNKE